MIDAAQHAAAAGDYAAAEGLLRDAVATQAASLGSSHPDLATTLNNLAFVCERTGKVDEAERGYRRAHAIAVASLSPGHPLIKTSLSNLVEFCEARGIPLWTPPETPTEDEPLPDDEADPSAIEIAPQIEVAPQVAEEPVLASRHPIRLIAAAALVIAAVVVIMVVAGPKGPARPASQGSVVTEAPRAVTQAPTESVAPAEPDVSKTATPVPPPAPESTVTSTRREPANADASVTVLKAQLCSGLEKKGSPDWQCMPASGDLPPGTYMFYTRLLTTFETRVEHRWYRDGRVHQTMRLRVSASPGSGYRTFSATTVSPERAGEWKVELRAADGTLLDQASFRVR